MSGRSVVAIVMAPEAPEKRKACLRLRAHVKQIMLAGTTCKLDKQMDAHMMAIGRGLVAACSGAERAQLLEHGAVPSWIDADAVTRHFGGEAVAPAVEAEKEGAKLGAKRNRRGCDEFIKMHRSEIAAQVDAVAAAAPQKMQSKAKVALSRRIAWEMWKNKPGDEKRIRDIVFE